MAYTCCTYHILCLFIAAWVMINPVKDDSNQPADREYKICTPVYLGWGEMAAPRGIMYSETDTAHNKNINIK